MYSPRNTKNRLDAEFELIHDVLLAARDVLHKIHRADLDKATNLYPGEGEAVVSAKAWCELRDRIKELDLWEMRNDP